MTQILLGVAMFTAVILLLVAILLAAKRKLVAHGDVSILINDDPDKVLRVPAGDTLLGTLAEQPHLHSVGLRRQGRVRRLRGDRQGRRRRPAAHRDRLHQPRRGEARLPARVPGQGQARHEDRDRARGLQRAQVDVQGRLEPQRRDVHQGAEARAARKARRCRSAPAATCRSSARRTRVDVPRLRHRPAVPRRPGTGSTSGASSRPSTRRSQRAYSMANYPNEKGILLFTIRIAFPPGLSRGHPAGDHELVDLRPEAGRRGHGLRARSASSSRATPTRRCASSAAAPGMAPMRSHIFDQFKRLHTQAQGHVLVRRAQPARGVLRRRVRGSSQREHPNFEWHLALSEPLPEDNWTGPTGFIHNVLHDQLPEEPPGARGHRVLHVRARADEQGRDRDAAVARRRPREHHARRLRLMDGGAWRGRSTMIERS